MNEFFFDWEAVATYLTVLILACFGGMVDFLNKLHSSTEKKPMKSILFSLLVKLMSSAFAGLIMFWILQSRAEGGVVVLAELSAVSISVSGYLGIRAVDVFVSIWHAIYNKGQSK